MVDSEALLDYVRRVHDRTYEAVAMVPDELVDWRPRPGEFTVGELVAHIAAARHMNAGTILGGATRYEGHELPPRAGANYIRRLAEHSSSTTLERLTGADLEREVRQLSGATVPAWSIMFGGLIEHEVHHRSQLCEYLGMNGIAPPPPLYGVHAEDLPR